MIVDREETDRAGRILTFYSFKGGVGRTMALANVAFLAAVNGHRVLVMDWDLEAPGLAYYFRGMQEGGARAIRTAPGILDLIYGWSSAVRSATGLEDVDALSERYASGAPFEEAVRPLLADIDLAGGRLDLIGAGGQKVHAPEPIPYEEALARFQWGSFFEEEAGGTMLTNLRDWSKRKYDFVLLDSRTGFADVAGICTMQIPDAVVLCFIYNRQNIDGVAQVAGAIRERRGGEVQVLPAPMRVARENTPEEADARAFARKELLGRGGLAAEDVDRGYRFLSVRLAANVPFYETIAMIPADRPETDPLVLNYLGFATEVLGCPLQLPALDAVWTASVMRRLQPKHATTDYVVKLRSSEPDRAIYEVSQLLEGALESGITGDGDVDYVKALVDLALHLSRVSGDPHEGMQMLTSALDLLRDLAESKKEWRSRLVDVLELYVEKMNAFVEPDEELLLLDEADGLLAFQEGAEARLRRIANRRRAARIQLARNRPEAARQILQELGKLIADHAGARRSPDRQSEIAAAEIDVQILRGDVDAAEDSPGRARKSYEVALRTAQASGAAQRPEILRLCFDAHSRLAQLDPAVMPVTLAAQHAVDALRCRGGSASFVVQFVDLGLIVLRAGLPSLAADYARLGLIDDERSKVQFASFFGRSPGRIARFIDYACKSLDLISEQGEGLSMEASAILDVALAVVANAYRRPRRVAGPKPGDMTSTIKALESAVRRNAAVLPESAEARTSALRGLDGDASKGRNRPREA